jgi:hypothetical protein
MVVVLLLMQILGNTSYRHGMQALSTQLQQDYKLRTPGQRAADEVEALLAGLSATGSKNFKQGQPGTRPGAARQQQQSQQEL